MIYRSAKLWCHTAQRGEIHYCSGQFPPKTKTFHSYGKAKLIPALHEADFICQRNCYFLTHFIYWMKDVSWELDKMSFMHVHTHPISLTLSHRRFPSFLLFVSPSHMHTVGTTHLSTYTVQTHAIISSCLTEKLLFSMLPCISDIKGASSLTVDSGWACLTSPHCCVKFPHQWCVYLVW